MKNVVSAAAIAVLLVALSASTAIAFEGGGRKPSEAPSIVIGQHYIGQLNNHHDDANYDGFREVAFWRLPPLTTRDTVVVNWHELPRTRYSEFPICMVFAQGVDDFSWGSVFRAATESSCDENGPTFSVSGSGSAQTTITSQATDASSSYLEFFATSSETNPTYFETFPYDFSIGAPLHYLSVATTPIQRIRANGFLHASVTIANGSPAPDGMAFTLSVTWANGGIASYAAASGGGRVTFPLALPESAIGKKGTFVVSHGADGQYQAASSTRLTVPILKPKALPPSECELATQRVRSLARRVKRLNRHAASARGATRQRLRRQGRRAGRQLRAARARATKACGAV